MEAYIPTDKDRELWRKATETPEEITPEERRLLLGLVDDEMKVVNAFTLSGLTPEELENNALNNSGALTEAEVFLLQRGYHMWDNDEMLAHSRIRPGENTQDTMARLEAIAALYMPHDYAIMEAVGPRADFFSAERRKVARAINAKVADNLHKPCPWVQKLINSGSTAEGKRSWGFMGLRDSTTECDAEVWDERWKQFDRGVTESGFYGLTSSWSINPARILILHPVLVAENNSDALRKTFRESLPATPDANSAVLTNTFLVIDFTRVPQPTLPCLGLGVRDEL